MYKNCLLATSYRNLIVYFLNKFVDDSEVTGIIFKILRKSFQILTKDSVLNNINLTGLNEYPDKIFESLVVKFLFYIFLIKNIFSFQFYSKTNKISF